MTIRQNKNKQRRYEQLVCGYGDWLFRYAYWLCGNRHEAEDLVQETYLRAWRFLDSLEEDVAVKSWLTTILRRENARKYDRKRLEFSDIEMNELPDHHDSLDTRPETLALRHAIRQLPPMYREPLMLQVLGGYSLKDIAHHFKIPSNTAATRLHRARQRLRASLEGTANNTASRRFQLG